MRTGGEDVCYWTIFTDLALSLFYFSVWELGTRLLSFRRPHTTNPAVFRLPSALSGSELALLATITPYILTHPRFSRLATSRTGQTALRTTAVALGMSAYALPGPASRLVGVSLANAGLWMAQSAGLVRVGGSVDAEGEALRAYFPYLTTLAGRS